MVPGNDSSPNQVVYRGREHNQVILPLAALLQDGKLNILDEVLGKKYFQIYSKGSELVFQCGGFIGLIPLNERVAIEVSPRVNVTNLDRILRKAGVHHVLLTIISKSYAATEEAGHLVDLMADAMVAAVEEIVDWGKHKEYAPRIYSGHPRSGRVLMKESFRLRAKSSGSVAVTTARFERTAENVLNACIKLALERLLSLLSGDPVQVRTNAKRISNLNNAWLSFGEIYCHDREDDVILETDRRFEHRDGISAPYLEAIPLALAVLRSMGPSQQNLPPSLSLGSLIFDMADAFERYVRNCLADGLDAVVLDGNLKGTGGAKERLFSETQHHIARNNSATPDVVIADVSRERKLVVLDAKYKTYQGMPEREDINQAVTYAVVYGCKVCGLIYLSKDAAGGVERFGKIGDIEVVGISIAIGAVDLAAEEVRFVRSVAEILGVRSP
jgi:5-methylcytosine-specific restriction enzyme subunit McrC